MKVGIDISSIIYGTGVSNYTQELINHLAPMVELKTFKFSRYPLMIMEFYGTDYIFSMSRHLLGILIFIMPLIGLRPRVRPKK